MRRVFLQGLVVLSLVLSLLGPVTAGATQAQCGDAETAPGLGLIAEGFSALSELYVDPIPPSVLLDVAAESARDQVERSGAPGVLPDPPKSWGDNVATATTRFTTYYCSLWDAAADGTSPQAVAYASLRSMAATMNEAHTEFLSPEVYQSQQTSLSGDERYEGIGARLSGTPPTIDYVFPESPAEAAGLREGDQIVRIDGQPVADLTAADGVALVRGEAGTTVTLGIRRPGVADELTFPIVRGTIRIPTLVSSMVGDVAHLRLGSFPGTRVDLDIASELESFNAMGARALILDLRANSGGRLDTGSRIAGLFLRNGAPLYRETTRQGRMTVRVSSDGPIWTKPIVVLIDGGTASMGELLAAALKEQAGATLIGTPTAGAVAGSITVPLSDGSGMQITTLRIDSSLGAMLNVDGLHPDINVPRPDPANRGSTDVVLEAALNHLRTSTASPTGAVPEPPAPAPVAP